MGTVPQRLFLSHLRAAMREKCGVNLDDVRALRDELYDKVQAFSNGAMSQNEADDFAEKTVRETIEYEYRAQEELERHQQWREQQKASSKYKTADDYRKALSCTEEQANALFEDSQKDCEGDSLTELIAELKHLREMAKCFIGHAIEYSQTSEYREKRLVYITTQAGEQPAPQQTETAPMTDDEILKRLVDTGFIVERPLKDKVVYRPKSPVTTTNVFDEIVRLTGRETRARNLMRQNMPGTQNTLNTHCPKKNYTT